MKPTDHGTRNLFATFSLRGGRLRKRGRGVVSYAPFLMGAVSAVVLGSLSALSTPSLAQPVDRLNVAAIDDVVAGDEGWIIGIDDVAADAGGWITAIDGVAARDGGGIAAYVAEAGGGFAAFGDVAIDVGGGIAAFGRVEEETTAFTSQVEQGIVEGASGPGLAKNLGDDGLVWDVIAGHGDENPTIDAVIAKLEDETYSVDDVVANPGDKTSSTDVLTTTTVTTAAATTIIDTFTDSRLPSPITITTIANPPVDIPAIAHTDRVDTTVITSGAVSGGRIGVFVSRRGEGSGDVSLVNDANIDGVRYGIRSRRDNDDGALNIVNNGVITNSLYGIYAVNTSEESDLNIVNNGVITNAQYGIYVANTSEGGDLKIQSTGNIRGETGILADHRGIGDIEVTNDADITGEDGFWITHFRTGDIRLTAHSGSVAVEDVGIYAKHRAAIPPQDPGNINLVVGPEASVSVSRHKSRFGIIHALYYPGNTRNYTSGEIYIDIAGSILGPDSRDAVYMSGGTRHELTLRPGFVLGGKPVVSELDRDTRQRVLILGAPHAESSVSEGVLNLSAEEFRGFDTFIKMGGNRWVVSGEADVDEEVFRYARIDEGILRFSGVTFRMLGHDPLLVGGKNVNVLDANLEVVGNNTLVGNLENATNGQIVFATEGEADTLTVTGDYKGVGKLVFEVLPTKWDDNDKLIIEGNAPARALGAGVSIHVLKQKDGVDLDTFIRGDSPVLIEAKGKAHAADFKGEETIGAYRYVLRHDVADGVNRWRFHEDGLSLSAKTASDVPSELVDLATVEVDKGGGTKGGIWGQQHSLRASLDPALVVGSRSRIQDDRVHFGFDLPATSLVGGNVVWGASMWQGFSTSDVSSGNSAIGIESRAAALTASWRSPNGLYVDGMNQYVSFSSSVSAGGLSLVQDNEGTGISALAEVGYRFAVPISGVNFHITPQMELVWSRVGFDDFVGPHNELVSLEDGDLVTGRLGLSWDGEWRGAGGSGNVYGGMNLRGALDGATAVNVSGVSLVSERGLLVDGRIGISYEWDEGYAVNGEVTALGHDGENEVRASMGVRIDF